MVFGMFTTGYLMVVMVDQRQPPPGIDQTTLRSLCARAIMFSLPTSLENEQG